MTKKIKCLAVLLIAAAILAVLAFFIFRSGFEGRGTAEKPYIIKDADDLKKFADKIDGGKSFAGIYFALAGDIDVSGCGDIFPMGTGEDGTVTAFDGTLDGRGNTICGIEAKGDGDMGLFSCLSGGIYNLTIGYGTLEGAENAGAFAAQVTESGRIINCCNYSNILGETAGAISGYTEGTLVNCVNVLDVENEPGVQNLTGSDDLVHSSNCYVYDGDNFELFVHGSADNQEKTYKRAVANLNDRIPELELEYPDLDFYEWEYREDFPNVGIAGNTADTVADISVNGTKAEYDFDGHFWYCIPGDGNTSATVEYTLSSGAKSSLECEDAGEIHFNTGAIENILRLYDEEAERKNALSAAGSIDSLNLSDDSEDIPGCYAIRKAYYNESGLVCRERYIHVCEENSLTLSGSLDGAVVFESEGDLDLTFDNLSINSLYAPAILIQNSSKAAITLADGSDNTLTGSNTMDIYSESYDKEEGVIASHCDTVLKGDTGRLYIKGDLEGIEVKGDFTMKGGCVNIDGVTDDGLSIDDTFKMNDGTLRIEAYDNVLDCSDVKLKGGKFIALGPTKNENCLKDNLVLDGVEMAVGFTRNKDMSDKSKQSFIVAGFGRSVDEGTIVLLADKYDAPIMAYKITKPVSLVGFSSPLVKEGTYRMYLCSDVDGEWNDEMCTDIKDYITDKTLTVDGYPEFTVTGVDNRFKIDK